MSEGVRRDYADAYAGFDLADEQAFFAGDLDGGLNAYVQCCGRHADGDTALIWESQDGRSAVHSFAQLKDISGRFANFLTEQGVMPGDRVAGLLPRAPELLITILATWRLGAVYQPLFTAFGPKAIEHRVRGSRAKLIVTNATNGPSSTRSNRSHRW